MDSAIAGVGGRPSRSTTERTRWRAALAAALALTLLGIVAARTVKAPWLVWADNLHWTAGYAAGALLAWRGYAEAGDALTRSAKRWLLAGMGLMLAGQVVWNAQVAAEWLVFPAPSDVFFLAIGPALAAGLWQIGRARLGPTEWLATRLDAATMLAAVLAATLALFLPRQGHLSVLQLAVLVAYAVVLVAPVCLGLTLMLALRVRPQPAALLLPLAALAFAAAWGVWNLRFLLGQLGDGEWLNIAFSLAAIALGEGIRRHRLQSVTDDARWDRRCEATLRLLPLVMVMLAAGGWLVVHSLPGIHPLFEALPLLACGAVVVLAAVRQYLLLGERDRLIVAERLLRQREAELEARVEERTRELARARDAAEVASRAKSAFLANMSHEIRTPMNSVLGLAHLALQGAREPSLRQHLERIQASGRHLMGLIDAILDMSKIEAGKLELEQVRFHVGEVFGGVELQLAPRARDKGLALRFDCEERLARQPLIGDPLRLSQVLLNMVGNAVKFTEAGRVQVSARRVSERASAGAPEGALQGALEGALEGSGPSGSSAAGDAAPCRVRFEVHDTGVGFDAAARARLFGLFQQADASTTRRHGGTGLGLAISRQLVELMGGEVGVDSEPGRGSRFWFVVPLHSAPPAPGGSGPEQGAESGGAALSGARILVAEDNEVNQLVATAMLQGQGASVVVAPNGEAALAALRSSGPFDCVLMDVQMPVMDGLEATRRIRADPGLAALPVIGMTANAWQEDRQGCLAAGMNEFTTKPVEPQQLYTAVLRCLRRPAGGGEPPG